MSRKGQQRNDSASRERLAHLGLAADRAGPKKSCPDDDRFAEMLESEAGSVAHRAFFQHLSHCESCFQKWLALSEELNGHPEKRAQAVSWFKRRPVLTGVGSACGLAMALMLYLAIDYRPVSYDRDDLQGDDAVSIGSSIAEPDERIRAEDDRERKQRPMSREGAPPVDSGLGRQAGGTEKQAEAPKTEEQPLAPSAPAPAAPRQKQTTGSAADFLEQEALMSLSVDAAKGPPASVMKSDRLRMEVDRRSLAAGRGAAGMPREYKDFIDYVADLCRQNSGVFTAADSARLLKQARLLLESEALPAGEGRLFIEYVANFLEKEHAIDDKERGEFCEKARTMVMEKERSGDKKP